MTRIGPDCQWFRSREWKKSGHSGKTGARTVAVSCPRRRGGRSVAVVKLVQRRGAGDMAAQRFGDFAQNMAADVEKIGRGRVVRGRHPGVVEIAGIAVGIDEVAGVILAHDGAGVVVDVARRDRAAEVGDSTGVVEDEQIVRRMGAVEVGDIRRALEGQPVIAFVFGLGGEVAALDQPLLRSAAAAVVALEEGCAGTVVGGGDPVLVVGRIHEIGDSDLLELVQTGGAAGAFAGGGQRRQQHGREDGDDSDYDQKFDQGEVLFHFFTF
ncbi:hypothetical protein SDC9_92092 [bioreactor metagenome]|uniref:Uncharacterized protein n=1 Tax=bioreactor metagenome TaxID=1076179 RepID=A0A644ZWV0_9ZZZZ